MLLHDSLTLADLFFVYDPTPRPSMIAIGIAVGVSLAGLGLTALKLRERQRMTPKIRYCLMALAFISVLLGCVGVVRHRVHQEKLKKYYEHQRRWPIAPQLTVLPVPTTSMNEPRQEVG